MGALTLRVVVTVMLTTEPKLEMVMKMKCWQQVIAIRVSTAPCPVRAQQPATAYLARSPTHTVQKHLLQGLWVGTQEGDCRVPLVCTSRVSARVMHPVPAARTHL